MRLSLQSRTLNEVFRQEKNNDISGVCKWQKMHLPCELLFSSKCFYFTELVYIFT